MRGTSLVAASLLGVAVLAPVAVQSRPAAASCKPYFDLWIRVAKPAVIAPGATQVLSMTWGVKPIPPNGYDNGTIINYVRWRIAVDSGVTIQAAVEKDPFSTDPHQNSVPAHIAGSTATFDLELGSSPLTKRAGLITVRLASTAAPGSRVRVRASIGVYQPSNVGPLGCFTDYRPGDNASTVYVTAAGHPKPPTHSASATPSRTPTPTAATPTPTPTPSASPSATDSPSPSPTPSQTALAAPLPTPSPAPPGSGSVPVAVVVAGSGGVGAALLGGAFALRRRRLPPDDLP